LAARHGEELLFNRWQKGQNAVEAGRSKRPHAFLIPREGQRDAAAVHRLLTLLAFHRIEVDEVEGLGAKGQQLRGVKDPVTVHDGDWLVRMDQPHRNFAKTLLLPQPFPKSAADNQKPYDDVAWSLDYMLGVTVTPVDDPAALGLAGRRLSAVPELPGTVEAGSRWIIEHRGQAALASLRWALPEGAEVLALREPWQGHGVGSLVIAGVGRDQLAAAVEPLHLHAVAIAEAPPTAATVAVNRPRVALFHSWRYTQDSGWLRFTLEQLQIPYTLIDKDDLRQGDLRNQYDLILIPSMGDMSFRDLVHGIDRKWSPLAYTQTAEYPSHGVIDSSPDITGGMGFEGL
ncbi:MAG: hypothetical protein KC457_34055, partial [Myxococcales bacterium]|nr:hypothetical protein [Myxococcales bacterium]